MRNYSLVYDPERSFFGILKARLLVDCMVDVNVAYRPFSGV
jgi:hypothetical protein